jgi:hypothetical protein
MVPLNFEAMCTVCISTMPVARRGLLLSFSTRRKVFHSVAKLLACGEEDRCNNSGIASRAMLDFFIVFSSLQKESQCLFL